MFDTHECVNRFSLFLTIEKIATHGDGAYSFWAPFESVDGPNNCHDHLDVSWRNGNSKKQGYL